MRDDHVANQVRIRSLPRVSKRRRGHDPVQPRVRERFAAEPGREEIVVLRVQRRAVRLDERLERGVKLGVNHHRRPHAVDVPGFVIVRPLANPPPVINHPAMRIAPRRRAPVRVCDRLAVLAEDLNDPLRVLLEERPPDLQLAKRPLSIRWS